MTQDFSEILKFAITLLSVLNPIGALPVFLTLTADNSIDEIKKVSTTCAIAVIITTIIGLIFGKSILSFFGISIASFRIGGGLLIASMAFSMLNAKQSQTKLNKREIEGHVDLREIGVVPLAIPLLAGPGAISTCIIQAEYFNGPLQWLGAFFVILLMGILIKFIFSQARSISSRMGTVGVNVLTRIMGLILMALAIEFMVMGIKQIFPQIS